MYVLCVCMYACMHMCALCTYVYYVLYVYVVYVYARYVCLCVENKMKKQDKPYFI